VGRIIPSTVQQYGSASLAEGCDLVRQALHSRRIGGYTLQAVMAAVRAEARSAGATDWPGIA
jgi:RNA polymerase sigma-70 factor, ECF subfamily